VGKPGSELRPDHPWKRRLIKQGGQNQHHDQVFGDFLGTGRSQLAFWNQRASTLFLAEVPAHPRSVDAWPLTPMATGVKPAGVPYIEGASAFDVDADGKVDALACDSWFKHTEGKEFKRVQFADPGGLIFAGISNRQNTRRSSSRPATPAGRFAFMNALAIREQR